MSEHRLLRASAGTGKTYQLTEAYASLITQGGLRPHEIIAITFTRKAASELKLRIRARLRDTTGEGALFTELAHAPITNFHGLALQLLRQTGQEPRAGILGDGEDARLFLQACEAAWLTDAADAAGQAAVAQVSRHLDVATALPAALWEAIGRAREDGRAIDAALLGIYDPQTAQTTADARLRAIARRLAEGLCTQTGKSREKLEAFVAAAAVAQAEHAPSPPTAEAVSPAAESASLQAWSTAWCAAFACIDRRGKLGALYSPEDKAAAEEAVTAPLAEAACAALLAPLGILVEQAWRRYEADKQAQGVMDFGDIIARVVAAMQNDAAIQASITQNIRAVLVDEAQDTNPLQRDMIRLLTRLTGPAAQPDNPAQLIVVGDRKQCIYTFRGADPQSFDLFAADIAALGGSETQLTVSRRSRPNLVTGINHLGEHMFGAAAYEPLAAMPHQDGPQGGMSWTLLPADAESSAPSPAALEARTIATLIQEEVQAGARPGDFAVLLATMTQAPLLAHALAQAGIPAVVGGGGGLLTQPEIQDILALLAWLCDPAARLEAAIALRSPLIGLSDGALTQLLHRPRVAQTPAAVSPALATDGSEHLQPPVNPPLPQGAAGQVAGRAPATPDLLLSLAAGRLPPLDAAGLTGDDAATLTMLARWLPEAREAARTMSVADCLQYCDAHLHISAVVRGQAQGAQRLANVRGLFDLAARFDDAHAPHVQDFVRVQRERLAHGHDEPLTPASHAERSAVRVCSVHQSKGLQFPRVILAFLNRRGRGDTACLRYNRETGMVFAPREAGATAAHQTTRWRQCVAVRSETEDAEQRRLLYVAVTRAEDQVYFVGDSKLAASPAGFARYLLPWRAAAHADGVLREQAAGGARAQTPPISTAAPGPTPRLMQIAPPTGAPLETTVTALAHFATDARTAPPNRASRGAVTGDATSELEPRVRGHLVHRVLSAIDHLAAHPSAADFVATQLEIAGFPRDMPAVAGLQADLAAFLTSPAARPILAAPATHRRHELPFVLHVPHPSFRLTLRGQLDLLYEDNEGPVIVDYKHAHEDPATRPAYLFQLDAYARAVAAMCNIQGPIRTRLVYLRDRRPPHEHLATDARRQAVDTALKQWADDNA